MKITYYGHSAFLLTAENGIRILTDPCTETGYDLKDIDCEVVTSSHDHFDHNYFAAAAGTPSIFNKPGKAAIEGINFEAVATWHDEVEGAKRGPNLVIVMEIDGLRIAHMGDIGHELNRELIESIGPVDVLLIPVGGIFTIDGSQAAVMAEQLKARLVVPMHYKTPVLRFDVADEKAFVSAMEGYEVMYLHRDTMEISKDMLPEKQVIVFDYKK